MTKPKDIDDYIKDFPPEMQLLLEQMRKTIKNLVPQAEEVISYGMPAFKMNGMIAWFGGFKNHIGFYPAPMSVEVFREELSVYKQGRGSVQFPLDKPLPLDLIIRIVMFRISENQQKDKLKKKDKNLV